MSTTFDADSRKSFAESVNRFVSERYPFETHRANLASADGFSRQTWAEIATLGWTMLSLPAERGGMDAGATMTGLVMEAIGRGLMLEPYLATVVEAGGALRHCAGQDADDLIESIAAGTCLAVLAHGVAPLRAEPGPKGWMITGAARAALHADVAEHIIVPAHAGNEVGLFLVDGDAPGLARSARRLLDGRGAATMRFHSARATRLDCRDAAASVASALEQARVAGCAEACGAMTALCDATVEFARTRRQFGDTIGSFQVIQHQLVDMTVAAQEAAAITRAAAKAVDAGHPQAPTLVSAAVVRTNLAGRMIGESAIQIHGGIGMTSELSAGAYFKRLLTIASLSGEQDGHLDRVAASAGTAA